MLRVTLTLGMAFALFVAAPVQAASISILNLVYPPDDPSLSILQITGSDAVLTQGGNNLADRRPIYYYRSDINDPASAPVYGSVTPATAWPLVYIAAPGALTLEAGITATVATVPHVDNATGLTHNLLTIEGLPVYQFRFDSSEDAHGGIGFAWPGIAPDGAQLTSVVPEPASAMLLVGSVLGMLALRRKVL